MISVQSADVIDYYTFWFSIHENGMISVQSADVIDYYAEG